MFQRMTTNDYGTRVSQHQCNNCGGVFTLCPAVDGIEGDKEWGGCCLGEGCGSYNLTRDIDLLWDHTIVEREDT